MIIPMQDLKTTETADQASQTQNDPPPTYTAVPHAGQPSTVETPPVVIPLPNVKPSNFVSLFRQNGVLRGMWLLDPSLHIPAPLLPPLNPGETEETRGNMSLMTSNGIIDADITIAPQNIPQQVKDKTTLRKISMSGQSTNGSITWKVHTTDFPRSTLDISLRGSNGNIYVHLPRSFHGAMVIKTQNGRTRFSDLVQQQTTVFSETDRTQRCFLGDIAALSNDQESSGWQGDELYVESRNGSVKIQFVDEGQFERSKGPGFFGKFFGL